MSTPDDTSAKRHKRDYWEVLGVSRDASVEEINKACRRIVEKDHPDRNPGDKEAARRAAEANAARDTLSDPDERAEYETKLRGAEKERLREEDEKDEATVRSFEEELGGSPGPAPPSSSPPKPPPPPPRPRKPESPFPGWPPPGVAIPEASNESVVSEVRDWTDTVRFRLAVFLGALALTPWPFLIMSAVNSHADPKNVLNDLFRLVVGLICAAWLIAAPIGVLASGWMLLGAVVEAVFHPRQRAGRR